MSMKRILGVMLASRMAGRGRGGGALGTAAAFGLLGSRGRGMAGKLGLAGLGYMAYQAYRGSQSRQTTTQPSATASTGGGLIDKLRDTATELLGGGSEPNDTDLREAQAAADRFSEDEALLMIRAMIAAAYADGSLSQEERGRIVAAINDSGATAEERATMEREIANPRPLDTLLTQVGNKDTAAEFYLASRAAIDGTSSGDRAYLLDLRNRLGLTAQEAEEAEAMLS